MIPLDSFGEEDELGRGYKSSELGIRRHVQVRLERDMILDVSATDSVRRTHQKHGCSNMNLTLWAEDRDNIDRCLLIGESNDRVRLLLNIMYEDTLLS